MSELSRRTALTAVAALPALAAPAAVNAAPFPDAELLELGRLFDKLERQHKATLAEEMPLNDAVHAKRQQIRGPLTNEEYTRLFESVGPWPTPDSDERYSAMDPVMQRIAALPATTCAGLAVKARVARFACGPRLYELSDEDANWNDLMVRKLIDGVLAAAKLA
jgi:hypothetical protein